MEPKPSIGRIVHYLSHGTPVRPNGTQAYSMRCRAAVVTDVRTDVETGRPIVSLCVLNPTGQFFSEGIPQDDSGLEGGTWHWPERA